mgnify:CR=1 FL=1
MIMMVAIPEGATVQISGRKLSVKGPKGTVEREFGVKGLLLEKKDNEIVVRAENGAVVSKALLNTIEAHVRNMLEGAVRGYERRMQVIYAHFPISLEVKGGELYIKNFLGEKQPRRARIVGATKVEVKGQSVIITGPSKEDVGQTVSNIKAATRIRRRDSRVFQDGLYEVG